MFVITDEESWTKFEELYKKQKTEELTMADILDITDIIKSATLLHPDNIGPSPTSLFDVYYDFHDSIKNSIENKVPFMVPISPEFYLKHEVCELKGMELKKRCAKVKELTDWFADRAPGKHLTSGLLSIYPATTVKDITYLMCVLYVATSLWRK